MRLSGFDTFEKKTHFNVDNFTRVYYNQLKTIVI
jgi:hypothetical protein